MIQAFIRYARRLVLVVVIAAVALVLLFLAVAVISRYEPDDGYCPDAPFTELEASILAFAEGQGMRRDEIEFIGMPRYHADKFGWWAFDLKSGETSYVATIDCGRRVTGFGKFNIVPLEPAATTAMQRSHSPVSTEPRATAPVSRYR